MKTPAAQATGVKCVLDRSNRVLADAINNKETVTCL